MNKIFFNVTCPICGTYFDGYLDEVSKPLSCPKCGSFMNDDTKDIKTEK